MATLTPQQLYALARGAGLDPGQAIIAAAVALAESGGDPAAVGDEGIQTGTWGPSVGLWQVRSLKADYGTGRARDAARLADPALNAASMAEISGQGASWRPWSAYTSGRYRQFIPTVTGETGVPKGTMDKPSRGPLNPFGLLDGVQKDLGGLPNPLDPFAAFDGWQSDLAGLLVKLGFAVAGVWLVVAGVKSAVGGDQR